MRIKHKRKTLKRFTDIVTVAYVWRGIGISKQTYFNAINHKYNVFIDLYQPKINELLDKTISDLQQIKEELNNGNN